MYLAFIPAKGHGNIWKTHRLGFEGMQRNGAVFLNPCDSNCLWEPSALWCQLFGREEWKMRHKGHITELQWEAREPVVYQ